MAKGSSGNCPSHCYSKLRSSGFWIDGMCMDLWHGVSIMYLFSPRTVSLKQVSLVSVLPLQLVKLLEAQD